jgi:hypothetical protein
MPSPSCIEIFQKFSLNNLIDHMSMSIDPFNVLQMQGVKGYINSHDMI